MGTKYIGQPIVGEIATVTAVEIATGVMSQGATWDSGGFTARGSATLKTDTIGHEIHGHTILGFAGQTFRASDADLVALVNAVVDHLSAKADFEEGRELTDWPLGIRIETAAEILEGKIPGAGKTAAEQ